MAIDEVNKALVNGEVCDEQLAIMRDRVEHPIALPPETRWWQEPQVIISGVVVSFSVGALIGFVLAK